MTEPEWAAWPDDKLIDLRICDLNVTHRGQRARATHRPASQRAGRRGLTSFEPHFWLSAEWFSPDGVPGVAIPFYLAHPRLEKLERTQMLEVEGGTPEWCMKILRHEAGPCHRQRLPASEPAAAPAGLRPVLHAVPRLLHAEALQ